MAFDKLASKLAITIPYFKLLKSADGVLEGNNRYNEPYIVSLAVDQAGPLPAVAFNLMPFPKVKPGESVQMLGDGHLIYGPKNPGDFVAVSVLVMESDSDVREKGEALEQFVKSKAVDLGLAAVTAANAPAGTILGILKELTQFIAGRLKSNQDDELFRTEGTFLRDDIVPYHINRSYTPSNSFVSMQLKIIPLDASNGQGSPPKTLTL